MGHDLVASQEGECHEDLAEMVVDFHCHKEAGEVIIGVVVRVRWTTGQTT